MTRQDDRFDRAMRDLHRESLAHLPPDTLHRLRAARAAAAGASPRRIAWPFASAAAALFVLAIALPLRSPPPPSVPTDVRGPVHAQQTPPGDRASAAQPAARAVAPVYDEIPATLAALEESPDFYLWLASNAAADALE